MKRLLELDTAALAAEYEERARAVCPDHISLALRVLDRLEPCRWKLEWHLPSWLGVDTGLEPAIARQLALTNVLGLASLRLRDDLRDGELNSDDRLEAPVVSAALYGAAIDELQALFPQPSELWRELALRMAEWREAVEVDPSSRHRADGDDVDRHLARRGAPLKVSALAVCLLAEQQEIYEKLAICLDHVLVALVLYDHLWDWDEDLAAGRWNAFVADASDRHEVLAGMMARDAIGAYMGRIHREFDRAFEISSNLRLPRLTSELSRIAAEAYEHATRLQAHYRQLGDRAVTLIFGNMWSQARSPVSVAG